jgi:hypothetical protein
MGVPNSEVSHISATTGRGDHEVHKGHVVALGKETYNRRALPLIRNNILVYILAELVKGNGDANYVT